MHHSLLLDWRLLASVLIYIAIMIFLLHDFAPDVHIHTSLIFHLSIHIPNFINKIYIYGTYMSANDWRWENHIGLAQGLKQSTSPFSIIICISFWCEFVVHWYSPTYNIQRGTWICTKRNFHLNELKMFIIAHNAIEHWTTVDFKQQVSIYGAQHITWTSFKRCVNFIDHYVFVSFQACRMLYVYVQWVRISIAIKTCSRWISLIIFIAY